MKITLLRNGTSGRGAGDRLWPQVEKRLQSRFPGGGIEVIQTSSAEDLVLQAERAVAQGVEVVVAGGGDGTINAVMQALVGSDSALAVIPLGTGNDFARTLGIDSNIDRAVETLAIGRSVQIDVARWRQGERSGYFLNVAGCGFDAAVAATINNGVRRLRGKPAYLYAILSTLFRYRPVHLSLRADGVEREANAMLCAIANAQSYGAGLRVAPMASLQDGLLDLVIVGSLGRFEFLLNLPKVLSGKHLDHPKVSHLAFRNLRITSSPPSPFLIDGELLGSEPVEIEVVPRALRVLVPKDGTACQD